MFDFEFTGDRLGGLGGDALNIPAGGHAIDIDNTGGLFLAEGQAAQEGQVAAS